MATSDDYSAVNVRYSGPVTGHQPTPLCGADDCGQPVQLPSNSYCLQCGQWFCSGCLKDHNKFRLFKGHTLTDKPAADGSKQSTTAPEDEDSIAATTYGECPIHAPTKEKHFCLTCCRPLCGECWAEEHDGHVKCKIERRVDESTGDLKKRISEIEKARQAELDHQQQLRKVLSDLQEERRTANRQIKEDREDVTQQRRTVEAKFNSAMQLNKQTTQNFAAVVQQAVHESDRRIAALNDSLAQIRAVEDRLGDATQTRRLQLLQDLPVVGVVRVEHVAAPSLLKDVQHTKDGASQTSPAQLTSTTTQSDVRHGTDVGCQVTLASSNHGTVQFRRRVAEIQPQTDYYSDELTVGHVPWSLQVRRRSDGRVYVWLWSDRHETLSADFKADVEFSARILHPTEPEKHVISSKRTNTFKRRSVDGWYPLCSWQDVVGLAHDGYLTIEIEVKVKQLTFLD